MCTLTRRPSGLHVNMYYTEASVAPATRIVRKSTRLVVRHPTP